MIADLSTTEGVNALDKLVGDRDVDVFCANAGYGLATAKAGWEAMKVGKGSVSPGWMGTLQQAILRVLPPDTIAEMNAKGLRSHGPHA